MSGPKRCTRSVAALGAAVLASVVLVAVMGPWPVAGAAVPVDGGAAWRYRPPVAAPVADPFRPPPEPWLPGNRGIEYATVAGTVVRAIGPGVVTFAGRVAGRRIVTVRHADGLRSSYVGLVAVGVSLGERVAGGEAIGRSTEGFHLGVRRGRTYLDPASLWGRAVVGHVVLVPEHGRHGRRGSSRGPGAGVGELAGRATRALVGLTGREPP